MIKKSMIKIGVVSDIHLGIKTYVKMEASTDYLPDPLTDRDIELMDCLYEASNKFMEQEVDYIMVAGDIFHTNQPAQKYQDLFWKWVNDTKVMLPNVVILIIPGNHDAINTSRELNAFSANKRIIDSMVGVSIVDKIKVTELFAGFNLLFVPHMNKNYYEYDAKLKTIKDMEKSYNTQLNEEIEREINLIKDATKPLLVLGHGYLKGTKQGYEINSETFYSVINKHPKVDYYIMGHVHKYQSTNDALVPGNAIYQDFGEIADLKKFCIVNIDTKKDNKIGITTYEYTNRKLIICELTYKDGEFILPPAKIFAKRIVRIIINVDTPADKAVVRQEAPKVYELFKEAYLVDSIAIEVKNDKVVKSSDELTYKNMTDATLLNTYFQEKGTDVALIKKCITTFQEKIEPILGEVE